MIVVATLAAWLALAVVFAAAVVDVVRYEIPDTASIVVLALAVVFGLATPGFAWLAHGGGALAMFAFGLLAFARGWLGGGDVKLMTAIAAWTGIAGLPLMFVAVSVAGGALALTYAVGRRAIPRATDAVAVTDLPYAVAIAIGTVWWAWATGAPFVGH